jgi:hypothetical protein
LSSADTATTNTGSLTPNSQFYTPVLLLSAQHLALFESRLPEIQALAREHGRAIDVEEWKEEMCEEECESLDGLEVMIRALRRAGEVEGVGEEERDRAVEEGVREWDEGRRRRCGGRFVAVLERLDEGDKQMETMNGEVVNPPAADSDERE